MCAAQPGRCSRTTGSLASSVARSPLNARAVSQVGSPSPTRSGKNVPDLAKSHPLALLTLANGRLSVIQLTQEARGAQLRSAPAPQRRRR